MNKKKENVWNFPRPAICELFNGNVNISIDKLKLADSNECYRTLEKSHPPTYYFPPDDVHKYLIKPNNHLSICEWKGLANYFDYSFKNTFIKNIGWVYKNPTTSFYQIKNYISFYASTAYECFVNGQKVKAQEGGFYGGWITDNLKGPFKGKKGTLDW